MKPRGGFTLLELLLSAAMVAVIGLTLYAAMSIGFRARGSAVNQVSAMRSASIAVELVQQDLQSAVPPPAVGAETGIDRSFVGYAMGTTDAKADSLAFCTIGRDDGDPGPLGEGMRRVELRLRTDVSPPVLVRRVERNLLAPVQQEPVDDEILARDVRSFGIRYYDGYGWLTEWDSTLQDNVLPLAVELTIELNEPRPDDATKPYRIVQLVPLPCGRLAEETTTMIE